MVTQRLTKHCHDSANVLGVCFVVKCVPRYMYGDMYGVIYNSGFGSMSVLVQLVMSLNGYCSSRVITVLMYHIHRNNLHVL
jgi:hypothetical protein